MKPLLASLILSAFSLCGQGIQRVDPLDGLWQGYDGEWRHVTNQTVVLAEAISGRQISVASSARGVRSVSEVLMHIAIANFGLLAVTGPKVPADLTSPNMEKMSLPSRKSSLG